MTSTEALEAFQLAKARSVQAYRQLAAAEALTVERQALLELSLHYVDLSRITYEWSLKNRLT